MTAVTPAVLRQAFLHDRLTLESTTRRASPIPWPAGLAPTPVTPPEWNAGGPLPEADVLVVTWTAAEGQALADVLSPGIEAQDWDRYTENWSQFEAHLTGRSPARSARCMAAYQLITIGKLRVCLVKSDLHLATDDATMPVKALWHQMIGDTGARLVITTGTAGGVGAEVVEGDSAVARVVQFDCRKEFKDAPFASESFPCTFDASGIGFGETLNLMAVNADLLRPEATRDPIVRLGDVITTDFFAMDTSDDAYGLRAYNRAAVAVEMDDASLGLAIQEIGGGAPQWISVRSASDPQIPSQGTLQQQSEEASRIYLRFGYAAQVATLCVVWQIIAAFGS